MKKKILPPFDRALKYLSIKQRSVKEVHYYLVKKQYSEDDINDAVKRLIELKFLNDDDFARSYTEIKQKKGKSKKLIKFELKLKGINQDVAKDVLEYSKSDYKTALEYVQKRMRQFERFDLETKKKKIATRLRSRGFSWETISKVLKKV
jgi:regulatory protein